MIMEKRPLGTNYEAWLEKIKAKYPDAFGRTTGEFGWSTLGCDTNGPTLTPSNNGPYYTDVSSRTYSSRRLVGSFNHNTNTGKLFVDL
jgi:hypothetical protein